MNRNQLQKIINDYRDQSTMIDLSLSQLKVQERALKTRQKFIKRKITILRDKLETSENEINWTCNDFDNLDIIF